MSMGKPIRRLALTNLCPKCGAPPGIACVGGRGERKAPHKARYAGIKTSNGAAPTPVVVPMKGGGFYASDEWRAVRYKALLRDGGACKCCGAKATRGKPLHVDHIKPRSKFPELALDLDNLQVLCVDCNLGKGAWDQTDWREAAQ
jgi:hypothetical protein